MTSTRAAHQRGPAPRQARAPATSIVGRMGSFFRSLGPGLVTGAADDDPSGISTYSQAGAAFGFHLLWTTPFVLPLMAAVQLMTARVALVSKHGLASVLRKHYPAWVLWISCALLIVANTINIAADLDGMAAAGELLTHAPRFWLVPAFAAFILGFLMFSSYERIASVFKWLTLVLFAYVGAAILAKPDWRAVAINTAVPHFGGGREFVLTIVAILGTSISPYLFFWQASQEVEQEKALEHQIGDRPRRRLSRELRDARIDVLTGMIVSQAVMYFIMLTAGATLHVAGETHIESAAQAAKALAPIAGPLASLLFALGIVGTGLLGVPVLAGSAAYAVAEGAAWRRGMDKTPRGARHFYGVMTAAMLLGMALTLTKVNPIRLLFLAAVVNGMLAPPLIVIILIVCNNQSIMRSHRNGWGLNLLGGLAALAMGAAAVALVVMSV